MLELITELQRLKNLDRTGWPLRGLPSGTESVAAHSFGVASIAMILADTLIAEGVAIDVERVLRMALLHDWAETRVGDMPRTAAEYFGADVRKRAETAALVDMVQGTAGAVSYASLHDEYEERQTLESRLVKAADVIDLLVQALALERAGAKGLNEFWEVARDSHLGLEGNINATVQGALRELLALHENLEPVEAKN